MATKVARLEREVAELTELAKSKVREEPGDAVDELTEVEVG